MSVNVLVFGCDDGLSEKEREGQRERGLYTRQLKRVDFMGVVGREDSLRAARYVQRPVSIVQYISYRIR
jgi:hypothetical protein